MSYLSTTIKKIRYLVTRDTQQILIVQKNDGSFVEVSIDTQEARDAAINTALDNLLAGAPSALNTLKEIADAIGDDANFSAAITAALSNRLQVDQNLSDLPDVSIARTNLGLESAAEHPATDFDTPTDRDSAISTAIAALLGTYQPGALNYPLEYDGTAYPVRPASAFPVVYYGPVSVSPTGMLPDDFWLGES